MRRIVDDLDGRRRALFVEGCRHTAGLRKLARERAEAENNGEESPDPDKRPEPLLSAEERDEFAKWRNLARFQPPVIDYVKAQVLTGGKRYAEALESLELVKAADMARPGLFLQTADLYCKLGRWRDAEEVYEKALGIDPDNPHAHVGKCRMALRRRRYAAAARSALDALERLYHYPRAHFLLGMALGGMKDYERAADALRVALSLNPNFPEAHRRLAMILRRRLNDEEGAREHERLHRETRMRAGRKAARPVAKRVPAEAVPETEPVASGVKPALAESIVIVTGLPRSGTSMIMQNRGYLEYEPVKNLRRDAAWVRQAKGKAIKIIAPLLSALPQEIPCLSILIERDLNEILNSQARMLLRRGETLPDTPERRDRLKDAYAATLRQAKAFLRGRPGTGLMVLQRSEVLGNPAGAAAQIDVFLGGGLATLAMAAQVEPSLHRQRS